jgi:hypothetical protein
MSLQVDLSCPDETSQFSFDENKNTICDEEIMESTVLKVDDQGVTFGAGSDGSPTKRGVVEDTSFFTSQITADRNGDEIPSEYSSEIISSEDYEGSVSECDSSTIHDNNADQEDTREAATLGRDESRHIYRFKIVFILIILSVAVVSSSCVYVFIKKAEQSRFEQKFNKDAANIFLSVRNSIYNSLLLLDSLSVALVSSAKAKNEEWPFVTIEDYGVRVAKMLPLTDAFLTTLLPVVTPANRVKWENYSRTHNGWVQENFDVQDTWDLYYGPKMLLFDEEECAQVQGSFGPVEENVRYVVTICNRVPIKVQFYGHIQQMLFFVIFQVVPCFPNGKHFPLFL